GPLNDKPGYHPQGTSRRWPPPPFWPHAASSTTGHDVGVLHDGAGEGREVRRRVAQLAGDRARAVGRHGWNMAGGARGRLLQGGRRDVVEAESIAVALRAVVADARMPGRSHYIRRVIARRGVTLGARRIGRDVVGRL